MNTYNPGSSFRFSSSWAKSRWHPVHKKYLPHRGEDWSATEGTAIPAAGDGIVVYKGVLTGYGNVVVLEHTASDDGEIIHTLYAHMNKQGGSILRLFFVHLIRDAKNHLRK
jgi:murein DD-endopeptidase MepM/ murein hydrolase activator NlpD